MDILAHAIYDHQRQVYHIAACMASPAGYSLAGPSQPTPSSLYGMWDFDDLCMVLWHHDRRVLWKGIGSPRSDIPPTDRFHSVRNDERALLDRLLESFAIVFAMPVGLPPRRACDHCIHLLPGTTPVAVRPYR
jgi:hypothetical protein